MAKPVYPKNRDGMWKAIRDLRSFTRSDVANLTGHNKTTISTYVEMLRNAGHLSVTTRPHPAGNDEKVYTLIKDNGVRRPLLNTAGHKAKPSARQKMWASLKVIGRSPFDFRDLSLVASVTHATAREYCAFLYRGGYLRIVRESVPGRTAQYVFAAARDTGPLAPIVSRDHSVVTDANTGKVVWQKGGNDA